MLPEVRFYWLFSCLFCQSYRSTRAPTITLVAIPRISISWAKTCLRHESIQSSDELYLIFVISISHLPVTSQLQLMKSVWKTWSVRKINCNEVNVEITVTNNLKHKETKLDGTWCWWCIEVDVFETIYPIARIRVFTFNHIHRTKWKARGQKGFVIHLHCRW